MTYSTFFNDFFLGTNPQVQQCIMCVTDVQEFFAVENYAV